MEAGPLRWWQPRPVLRRLVSDLLEDELVRQRRGGARPPQPWPEELQFERDLGVDSLERMLLATALAETLHLHESGIEDYLLARRTLGDWVDIAEAGLTRYSERLTFRTSGSSGLPKPCTHSLASLLQETEQLATLFQGRRRVLCAVPGHHIYGFLFTVLLPRALGLAPDAVLDVRGCTPAWLGRGARPGDLVIGHPDFWQAVARTVPQLPADVVGVTSTAPCPDSVSEAVERAGLELLFHVYGSSETGGIGWRASFREPYQLLAHWTFAAGDDPQVLLRQLADGSQLTATSQDRIERSGQRRFRVGARHDDAVQVGGINVFPARVGSVLRQHPLVQDVAVRLMRPEEGTRLKAYVVPWPEVQDEAMLLAQLQAWIDTRLPVPERPRAIRVGSRLPVSDTGKLADWSIEAGAAGQRHW